MATRRKCFFVDTQNVIQDSVVYCSSFRNIKNQLNHYKQCYFPEIPDMKNKITYVSNIFQDIQNMRIKGLYIHSNILKFNVDG